LELHQRTKQARNEEQIKERKLHWTGNLRIKGRGGDKEPGKAQENWNCSRLLKGGKRQK